MKVNFVKTTLKITAGLKNQLPNDRIPQIALSGRSNVGKSSMINCLIERKSLARVSSTPGKTITVNFYDVDSAFCLVDLPGYGFAKRSGAEREKWSELVDGYFENASKNGNLRAVVQLIDLKVGPTADDETMLDYLRKTETPFFAVATKADKLNKTEYAKALEKLKSHPMLGGVKIIPFSAQNGMGRDEIRRELISALESDYINGKK
jgi:GTP-binding protein